MMRPLPCASIRRPAACERWNTESRLTASTSSQSAAACSAAGARRMVPALLTRMSMRPSASTASSIAPCSSSAVAVAKSRRMACTRRPSASIGRDGLGRVAAVDQRDIRAGLGEREGGALTESAAGAGDDGDAAVEPEGVEDHAGPPVVGAMKRVVSSPIPETRTVTLSPCGERPVRGLRLRQLLRGAGRDDVARFERHHLAEVVHDERRREDRGRRCDCETVTTPSRTTSTSRSCGSGTSSAVTTHGPSGAKPSKHLPSAHWLCRRCQARSDTSLRIV